MTVEWITADVFAGLATLDDRSVDLVVTSPPFLALRSYLPADHPDKAKEIGAEKTPAEYIDTLLAVTTDLRRVLAPHGSICIELGDTYAGSGGAGGDYADNGMREGQPRFRQGGGQGWPLPKSKALIPQLLEVALAYGINPLTGQESLAGQWRVRNIVTWCRPNPPVGQLGDKWRPATSDVIVACTSEKRYWDDLATRQPAKYPDAADRARVGHKEIGKEGGNTANNPAGTPLLDYWEISPGGYAGAHYAVFPPTLVEPLIRAMCPERVCRECGKPSQRIVAKSDEYAAEREAIKAGGKGAPSDDAVGKAMGSEGARFASRESGFTSEHVTVGWTDCGHNDWRPGTVLDPFAGSGTTLAVAEALDRNAIGIEIDSRNQALYEGRVYDPYIMGLRQMGLFDA